MTSSHERPRLVSKLVVVEDTREFVTIHDKSVFIDISVDGHVWCPFVHHEWVAFEVVIWVFNKVGNLDAVDDLNDCVEVCVFGLFKDTDVHGGFQPGDALAEGGIG